METYGIRLFMNLNETLKEEINQCAEVVSFKKGDPLFCGDELMHYFYVIITGKMKTYQLNLNNAREQTIFILKQGDMLDTITLLDGKPHEVIHEALEDIKLLQMPIEKVQNWLANSQAFSQKFFPYLASQMRQIEELATDMSLHTTSERLSKLILQNFDPTHRDKYNLLDGLSHNEIGKLIGTVRHVVERHLHQLQKEDILEVNKKHLFIKNIQKLLEKI